MLIGDSEVGKSSIILRYTDNTFNEKLINSIAGRTKWFCFPKNTTAENMAAYLFSIFQKELENFEVKLEEVRVWETETSVATYRGE